MATRAAGEQIWPPPPRKSSATADADWEDELEAMETGEKTPELQIPVIPQPPVIAAALRAEADAVRTNAALRERAERRAKRLKSRTG